MGNELKNGGAGRDDQDASGKALHQTGVPTGEEGARYVFQILLIEDSPGDVRLTEEALREINASYNLSVVPDGVEALAFLYRDERYRDAPRPDLILLDLNLPRKNGREVLAQIKGDSGLGTIPVIVLTISTAEEDIITSYNLHANCYIIKPVNLEKFFQTIQSIGRFWLEGRVAFASGRVTNGS